MLCFLVFRYKLKDSQVLEVNPHFYHYPNPNDQSNALENILKRRKESKNSQGYFNVVIPDISKTVF